MAARKLLYWLLVSSPAILLLAAAIDARLLEDPFELPMTSDSQNSRIAAYGGPVRATAPLLLMTPDKVDATQVEAAAALWTDGLHRGVLQPLYASSRGEGSDQGVKAEIFAAKRRLCTLLTVVARQRAQQGQANAAAADLLASLEIGEVVKYSDFGSVASSCHQQRRALDLLTKLRPYLTHEGQEAVAYHLTTLLKKQRGLGQLVGISYRLFLEGEDAADVTANERDKLSKLPAIVEQHWPGTGIDGKIDQVVRSFSTPGAMFYCAEVKLGLGQQREILQMLQTAVAAYPPRDRALLAGL